LPVAADARWVGGNVRDHRLRAIWEQSEALRYTREHRPERLWGSCAGCYYADACRGGCTWTATTLFARSRNNPYCHHRALEHQARGQRERVVQRESAPGEPFDYGRFELIVEPVPAAPVPAAPVPAAPMEE
jgi:radical SAM protein with 4Fe4S-binding SPASM domain